MRRGALRSGLAPPALALAALAVAALALPAAASARDSLGVWNDWGAFRDVGVPRCYAIAMPIATPGRRQEFQPYMTIGTWPRRAARNEIHVRLGRRLAAQAPVTMVVGNQRFALVGGGADAWAPDRRIDAAAVAALRSAATVTVIARAADGRTFRDTWRLAGAATAIDAAALGCARI